jgi:hypothetical protein
MIDDHVALHDRTPHADTQMSTTTSTPTQLSSYGPKERVLLIATHIDTAR